MTDTKPINMSFEQACEVKRLLRNEVVTLRTRANRLIHNTNNRQAGFNVHGLADQLDNLADTLDREFPEEAE